MFRRGSLSISTNAIVVLIVAVIMLGLIIGLVTRGFGAVERKFLGQIEETEPEPPTPSVAKPITISTAAKFASPGELIGFKVAIANNQQSTLLFKPAIRCVSDATSPVFDTQTTAQVFEKSIEVGRFATFTLINKLNPTTTPGDYLCQIYAETADQGTTPFNFVANPQITPAEFRLTVEG